MMNADIAAARILIIDDEPANVRLLERMLVRAGHSRVWGSTDPRAAPELMAERGADLVLLDLHMPFVGGLDLMQGLRALVPETEFLPFLVLTADSTAETRQRALAAGAHDFLTKPFDTTEVLLRVRNLLRTRMLHLQLRAQNERLEERVRERTRELEIARLEALEQLARAAEFRDDATGQHTRRVGELAARIALALGTEREDVELLRRAAPLHDIGKIGVPDRILLKPGRLTDEEFDIIKTHTTIGAGILAGSRSPVFILAEQIAHSHHERWDGRGYPQALSREAIPLPGRIVAVADVFDALTHARPYKPALAVEESMAEIRVQRGRQFDPAVVDAFEDVCAKGGTSDS